jgi:CRISPR-associated protein Csm2
MAEQSNYHNKHRHGDGFEHKKQHSSHNQQVAAPKQIILDYIKEPELFNSVAKDWIDYISAAKKSPKPTQMRAFYEYVLKQNDRVQKESFEHILPFVKMLNSKVNYAIERGVANKEFGEMINQCVAQISTPQQLENFKMFFEAVLGFSKSKGE